MLQRELLQEKKVLQRVLQKVLQKVLQEVLQEVLESQKVNNIALVSLTDIS